VVFLETLDHVAQLLNFEFSVFELRKELKRCVLSLLALLLNLK
jgi:hypothetical protein